MILVTGGAGYLGAVLVRELLDRGYAVRVLDRLMFGLAGLEEVRDKIDLVRGDVRSFDASCLDGISAVVHLAGLSNDPMAEFNPRANHEMNAVATEVVGRAAVKRGVRRLVLASSCSLYDRGLQAEDVVRDEDAEVRPRAAYAVSKREAEERLLALVDDGLEPVLLRNGTVFGYSPRMRYDLVVNTFVRDALSRGRLQVHGGGEMWRPLVEVRDAARACIVALEADGAAVSGQVFNVVERNYRVLELAHLVRHALRDVADVAIDVQYEAYRGRSYRVSGRKAESVLGFRPAIGVAESVLEMVRLVREKGKTDFLHPRYDNIAWLRLLVELEEALGQMGPVF